eukprot:3347175-Amphidinium_carterae.1
MELMLQLTNTGWIWKRMPSQTPGPYMLHGVESETKVPHHTSQVIHNPQSQALPWIVSIKKRM